MNTGSQYLETGAFHEVAFHGIAGLMGLYVGICWLGAAIGTLLTEILAQYFLHLCLSSCTWAYGQGVIKAWREISKTGGKAGVGHQIDDRTRTV